MKPVITFFFIIISAMYLYGYYTYYLKEKKRLPKCNVIYILDEGLKDDHRPDFNEASKRSNRNISQKTKVRENIKQILIKLIKEKTGFIFSGVKSYDKIIEKANKVGINDQEINSIIHEEILNIRGNI